MTKPKDVLTEYEDIYLRLADLQAELERARKEAIPPEVRELLETIEAEYKPKIEALQEKLKLAESGVKQLAFDLEMTLRGNVVMAVYRKGSTK